MILKVFDLKSITHDEALKRSASSFRRPKYSAETTEEEWMVDDAEVSLKGEEKVMEPAAAAVLDLDR